MRHVKNEHEVMMIVDHLKDLAINREDQDLYEDLQEITMN